MDFTSCPSDELFGPAVQGCRGDFDFTIKFEKIFFSLLPGSVFAAIALTRVLYLATSRPTIIGGAWLKYVKLVSTLDLHLKTGN